jgi:predicted transcriptional regulator
MAKPKTTDHFALPPLHDLPPSDKLVWAFVFEHGEQEYTMTELGERLCLVRRTVQLSITRLIECGLLTVTAQGSGRRPHRLRALSPDPTASGSAAPALDLD